jgi:transposase InsO family protein
LGPDGTSLSDPERLGDQRVVGKLRRRHGLVMGGEPRGLGHLAAIIDCCDREIVGWEFSLRGRAREAERALEEACLARFGTLRPEGPTPVVRSDNGLIFTAARSGRVHDGQSPAGGPTDPADDTRSGNS